MYTWLLMLLSFGFLPLFAQEAQMTNVQNSYKEIHTKELKTWLDEGKTLLILDARSKEYFDGVLLPNAIWLPYTASKIEIEKVIPSKDYLIVVYCSNPACRASKFLAEHLVDMGYTNVYKYHEGLQDWFR